MLLAIEDGKNLKPVSLRSSVGIDQPVSTGEAMRIPNRLFVFPRAFKPLLVADIRRLALDALVLEHPNGAAMEFAPILHRLVDFRDVARIAAEGVSPLAGDNRTIHLVREVGDVLVVRIVPIVN